MITKERKRYHGILDLRDKSVRNFHLNPNDFPGLSFEKANLGKIRLDQNDGTDVPLAQIPDILTGKDADTVDSFHLDQSVLIASSPTFAGLIIDTNTLCVDNVNHKVGIGTTEPTVKLGLSGIGALNGIVLGDEGEGSVNLYRHSVGQLRTDNYFRSEGLGIGADPGSAAALIFYADSSVRFFFYVSDTNVGHERTWIFGPGIAALPDKFVLYDQTAGAVRLVIDSLGHVGIGATTPTAMLDINSDILRLRTSKTPSSGGDTGNAGDICWDSNYIYVCVATNTWKRIAISSWGES